MSDVVCGYLVMWAKYKQLFYRRHCWMCPDYYWSCRH